MRRFTSLDYKKLLKLKEVEGTWKSLAKRLKISPRTLRYWRQKAKQGKEVNVRGKNTEVIKRIRNIYYYEYNTKPKTKVKKKFPLIQELYASNSKIRNNLSNAITLKELLEQHKKDNKTLFEFFVQFKYDLYKIIGVEGENIKQLVQTNMVTRLGLQLEHMSMGYPVEFVEDNFYLIFDRALENFKSKDIYIFENLRIEYIWVNNYIEPSGSLEGYIDQEI